MGDIEQVDTAQTGESRDGTGSGDHDTAYVFGNPRACLTLRMQARLQIMRGYVMDARRGLVGGCADGDIDIVFCQADNGLLVPLTHWPDDA